MDYYKYRKYYQINKKKYLIQKGGINRYIRTQIKEFYKTHPICNSPNFYLENFRSLKGLTPGMSNSAVLLGDLDIGDEEMGSYKVPVIIKEITINCKYLDDNIIKKKEKFDRDILENKTIYSKMDSLIMEIGLTKIFCDEVLLKKNIDGTRISNNFLEFYTYGNCQNIYPNPENISKCTLQPIIKKHPDHNIKDTSLYKNIFELYQKGKFLDSTNVMLVEKAEGDLTGLIEDCYVELRKNNIDEFSKKFNPLFNSILKQTINCLVVLNAIYGEFYHNDMHLGNILFVRKEPQNLILDLVHLKSNTLMRNQFNDMGICIKMWDFATSYAKTIFEKIGSLTIPKPYKDDFPLNTTANYYSKSIKDDWLHENFGYMQEDQIFNIMKHSSNDFSTMLKHFDQFTLDYLKKYSIVHYFDLIKSQESYKLLLRLKDMNFKNFADFFTVQKINPDEFNKNIYTENYFRLFI